MTKNNLYLYEKKLWSQGITYVAGVDEAGRGPLAGPIVIAAVILDKNHSHDLYSQINDSKKISQKKREVLSEFILENALAYKIEEISSQKIDEWGIGKSNQIGFFNAVKGLEIAAEHVLTDHFAINGLETQKQTNITKGDSISISIAAASILAKVHRDKIMMELHEKFPEYGFDKHKGYGTKFHRDQILRLGPCLVHRRSFAPVSSYPQ